ncbi:MAG: alpha/beta fold hydrolase [Betaproteobacteria bacterium]
MSTATPKFVLPPLPDLRQAPVFGRKICYYDIGHGPPLVLVHGVGGDADQWVFCLNRLAESHRVIAIDLPGFGRSDKPLIDYRIAGFVEMLDRFVSTIGISRASFLGHSLGGWIVATFSLRFPDRVDKLILNDAAGIDAGAVDIPVDLKVSTRANMRAVFEAMFYDKAIVSDDLVDLAYSLHLERGDGYTIRSVLETLTAPREKLDRQLGGLKAPTLILWGEDDAITPLAMAHAFQRGIAGSRLQVIARCGHLPPLERPDAFVSAVTSFLTPASIKA